MSLWERVSWGDSGSGSSVGAEERNRRRAMARGATYLAASGGTLALIVTLGGGVAHTTAIVAIAIAAYLIAAVSLIFFDRAPLWSFQITIAAGTLLITAVIGLGGSNAILVSLQYFWLVIYAAYFFTPRQLVVQIGFLAATYGAITSSSRGLFDWFVTVATLVVTAYFVYLLRQRLQRQIVSLRELDRAKGEFLAMVSHELRTPLTSIIGYLELVCDDVAGTLTEEQKNSLGVIKNGADRLAHLVNDILLLAQADAGKLVLDRTSVDLTAVAADSVRAAEPSAHAKAISLHLDGDSVTITGDRMRLGQVFDNLLTNATKFTPSGGSIGVRISSANGSAIAEVSDTGMGIPAADQEHVFDRFYRTSAATTQAIQGSGLGLAIAKNIIENHQGSISVEGHAGSGTTFRIKLPVTRTKTQHSHTEQLVN